MPKGRLFLVDGDNHIYEGLTGICNIRKEDTVQVYVSQTGLSAKISSKYGNRVDVKNIKPGDQAVDNAIKSRIGKEAKADRYTEVVVLSHDKGYKSQIDKAHRSGKKKYRQAESIWKAIQ